MTTHEELHRLVRAAYRTDAPDVLRWLDLRTSDERITWQAAAQIIRLPDPALMGEVLDWVRKSDALRRPGNSELAVPRRGRLRPHLQSALTPTAHTSEPHSCTT